MQFDKAEALHGPPWASIIQREKVDEGWAQRSSVLPSLIPPRGGEGRELSSDSNAGADDLVYASQRPWRQYNPYGYIVILMHRVLALDNRIDDKEHGNEATAWTLSIIHNRLYDCRNAVGVCVCVIPTSEGRPHSLIGYDGAAVGV